MPWKHKLKGIFSVSAASFALLQGTPYSSANIPPLIIDRKELLKQSSAAVEKLILAPPTDSGSHLFAGHRSHSSHLSHSSHRSHSSHYSSSSRGSYSPPTSSGVYVPPAAPPATYVRPTAPIQPRVLPNTNRPVTGLSTNTNHFGQPLDDTTVRLIEFWKLRAAQGSDNAQYQLGLRHLTGDGVEKDAVKGKLLLEMSAKQGNAQAKLKLKELNQKP